MANSIIELQTKGFRLTTAEILYFRPDHPFFLQTYLWQELDKAPNFPTLMKFLDFWERELDGKLHSVQVQNAEIITPKDLRFVDDEFILH